eukprot:TRINITY_DN5915_c0_g1_i1.p1 TRINITY_DN5915_c0_g1~~TRINITY_DN5915_c0_g1_i1.p1  ORF type:complete len:333 (-),score=58.25 TRINITY_DN5915_c0_g1_i1:101-1099(-)
MEGIHCDHILTENPVELEDSNRCGICLLFLQQVSPVRYCEDGCNYFICENCFNALEAHNEKSISETLGWVPILLENLGETNAATGGNIDLFVQCILQFLNIGEDEISASQIKLKSTYDPNETGSISKDDLEAFTREIIAPGGVAFEGTIGNARAEFIKTEPYRVRLPLYVEKKACTLICTHENFTTQPWFVCNTCTLVGGEGCCETCLELCHDEHDTAPAKDGDNVSRFYCDCYGKDYCKAKLKPSFKHKLFEIHECFLKNVIVDGAGFFKYSDNIPKDTCNVCDSTIIPSVWRCSKCDFNICSTCSEEVPVLEVQEIIEEWKTKRNAYYLH